MARCAIEVETLEGARMQCEITAGHPGPHMNGIHGLVPGNITWEWRPAQSASSPQDTNRQITQEVCTACFAVAQISHYPECVNRGEPERSDGLIQGGERTVYEGGTLGVHTPNCYPGTIHECRAGHADEERDKGRQAFRRMATASDGRIQAQPWRSSVNCPHRPVCAEQYECERRPIPRYACANCGANGREAEQIEHSAACRQAQRSAGRVEAGSDPSKEWNDHWTREASKRSDAPVAESGVQFRAEGAESEPSEEAIRTLATAAKFLARGGK
jgi:hypothetical protein